MSVRIGRPAARHRKNAPGCFAPAVTVAVLGLLALLRPRRKASR